jgi:hypothetical protein
LQGSVAAAVIAHSTIPVMVVPEGCRPIEDEVRTTLGVAAGTR